MRSYSILEFGRTCYENAAYFNFKTNISSRLAVCSEWRNVHVVFEVISKKLMEIL